MTKFAKNGQNCKICYKRSKNSKPRQKNVGLKGLGFRGLKPKNAKFSRNLPKFDSKPKKDQICIGIALKICQIAKYAKKW